VAIGRERDVWLTFMHKMCCYERELESKRRNDAVGREWVTTAGETYGAFVGLFRCCFDEGNEGGGRPM
jgi:hypothetical protein